MREGGRDRGRGREGEGERERGREGGRERGRKRERERERVFLLHVGLESDRRYVCQPLQRLAGAVSLGEFLTCIAMILLILKDCVN